MDVDRVRRQLEIDEGVVYEIYLDHLDYPTFGIGHLIQEDDPEAGLETGIKVSKERVRNAFEADLAVACSECSVLYLSLIHI